MMFSISAIKLLSVPNAVLSRPAEIKRLEGGLPAIDATDSNARAARAIAGLVFMICTSTRLAGNTAV